MLYYVGHGSKIIPCFWTHTMAIDMVLDGIFWIKNLAFVKCLCESLACSVLTGVLPSAGVVLLQAVSTLTLCLQVNYWLWSSVRRLYHTSNHNHSQTQTLNICGTSCCTLETRRSFLSIKSTVWRQRITLSGICRTGITHDCSWGSWMHLHVNF